MWSVRIVGALMFVAGFTLIYFINRKRFNRRTITGLQAFKSFEHAWSSTYLEKFGKLIGMILILAGSILFVVSF